MKGTIKLYGAQVCHYLYAAVALTSAQQQAVERGGPCPEWGTATRFRIDFANGLIAGNESTGNEPPTQWRVYRQRRGEARLTLAGVVGGDVLSIADYAVAAGTAYRYQIQPVASSYIGAPIITQYLTTAFDGWTLMVVDRTGEENAFTIGEIYLFELNPADTAIQNNTTVSRLTNFTPYLKLQHSSTNCWSGTLSALLGRIASGPDGRYFEDVAMAEAVKSLSTERRPMFLRDPNGRLMRVGISSAVTLSQAQRSAAGQQMKQLEFTEIGPADGVQITGVQAV